MLFTRLSSVQWIDSPTDVRILRSLAPMLLGRTKKYFRYSTLETRLFHFFLCHYLIVKHKVLLNRPSHINLRAKLVHSTRYGIAMYRRGTRLLTSCQSAHLLQKFAIQYSGCDWWQATRRRNLR